MNPDQVTIMHSTIDGTTVSYLPAVMYLHHLVCPRNTLEPISIWVLCLPYPWNKFLKIRVCNSCRLVVMAVKSLNHLSKSILFWPSQIFFMCGSINIKCKMLLTLFFVKSVC